MTLRVEQGKGLKGRDALPSLVLLERLRICWRVTRAQRQRREGCWLFPGLGQVRVLP